MKIITLYDKKRIKEVVDVHMQSFSGFFLTFLGKGFLKQLYKGFMEYPGSRIVVCINNDDKIIGFLAFSDNLSGFYKYLIKKHLISFSLYSIIGFIKKPRIFFRLIRAFTYSKRAKRNEAYVELSSIGVLPQYNGNGVGSKLIDGLKKRVDWNKYAYIKLETDAVNNKGANSFYIKNGFVLSDKFTTHEGRKMNEYRYYNPSI